MKINIIVPGIFKSGGMRVIFEYANRFTNIGHDVKLYYPRIGYDLQRGVSTFKDKLRNYYYEYKYLKSKRKLLKNFYESKFEIKPVLAITNVMIRNADFTIATSWPTAYSVFNLSSKKGIKIYFIQDYETWNSNLPLVDNSYKLNMHRVTISNYLKNLLKFKFNSDSSVIPNGINFDIFNNGNKNFNQLERISFINYELEKKNTEFSIGAVKEIKKLFPEIQFTCFGYDRYHEIPDYVNFIKNPSDNIIREIYSKSDVFLYTSNQEGFGLPPFEAIACKCAVISTKVGAIPDYLINDESAKLIDPGNEVQLLESVNDLFNNPEKLKSISLNGYNTVKKNFDWEKSAEKLEKFMINL